jgi:flavodoxin/nitroimidazol reductase NimA-like FMN-containing flavoprotein (pyridoxamine 5'-phosphate oxidase superfamily)
MLKTLIIYESKYGTTRKIARYLSMVLGPATYCRSDAFSDLYRDYDFIVIGSPVYSGRFHSGIYKFVENNLNWLKENHVALFCTCISMEDGNENLEDLSKMIGDVIHKQPLGGILNLKELDDNDKKALEAFSKKLGFKLNDIDNFSLEKVLIYAIQLKSIKDELAPKGASSKVRELIDEFLSAHNTCTLSTSYKNRVRSTPIEYSYSNGFMYLISEGGEKFCNIPLNKYVSLAVYDDYTGMDNLAGMQITGEAFIVPDKSEEYEDIIKMKGLNIDYIKNMPFKMNIIKIKIQKIEFLYSKFKELGYDVKQIYNY